MNSIKMEDVARHANVSIATVTRALNEPERVSVKTRERIMKSIDELNYIPNRMASALKNHNTGILGNIMLSTEDNPYFSLVRERLSKNAEKNGFHLMTITTDKDERKESYMIDELMGWMVEGFFFTGQILLPQSDIEKILRKNIPVIMIERPIDVYGVDKVFINDIEGSSIAAHVFLSHGHRHIAFIGVDRPQRVESGRYNGFRQTLEKNDVELSKKDTVFVKDYSVEDGYRAAQCLFEHYAENSPAEMPTAYFVSCDILACGVLQFLYEKRIRVPEDISIIGYDNTTSASSAPQISTIAMPFDEIGKSALALFLERKNQKRLSGKSVELSPYFIERHSVRDLNK